MTKDTRPVRRGSFLRRPKVAVAGGVDSGARYGFDYLEADSVYLDAACQTLRPRPVIDALNDYYLTYNACGERGKYPWGQKVDERVGQTRRTVLTTLGLSPRRYTTSFTLNTTYALNLLLHQLPTGRYRRVVTTHTEHNSVFLSTMTFARRAGVERLLLDRDKSGSLVYGDADLADAVVVVAAMNNFDGASTAGLAQLITDVRRRGGTIIVDAAQAVPHALSTLRGLAPDAFCFSAHKVYGASLGVVAASNELLESLELTFVGGGQVASVEASGFELLPDLHTRLEAGLQPSGEIIALGAALTWLDDYERGAGEPHEVREERLSQVLFDGLSRLQGLTVLSPRGSSLVTVLPDRIDGHRLAAFLARAGIMVRSGHFCAHHWLKEVNGYPPLVRFSLGAHNTDEDVERTLDVMGRLMKGL